MRKLPNPFIGKASRLARTGEIISVRTPTGQYITARVGDDLISTQVLVFVVNDSYIATPTKRTTVRGQTRLSFNKSDRTPLGEESLEYAYGYYCNSTFTPIVPPKYLPSFTPPEPPEPGESEPEAIKYYAGFFDRGFLDFVGAPSFDGGFFYPTDVGGCPTGFRLTGYPQNAAAIGSDTKKVFTEIQYLLVQPNTGNNWEAIIEPTTWVDHLVYSEPGFDVSTWNYIYGTDEYYLKFGDQNTPIPTGYNKSNFGNIPWSVFVPAYSFDGSPLYNGSRQFGLNIAYPNYWWRGLAIWAVAYGNTLYLNERGFSDGLAIARAKQYCEWVRFTFGGQQISYNVRVAPASQNLPPARIVGREYLEGEKRPSPPISGSWSLLFDNQACPSEEPISEPPPEEYPTLEEYNLEFFVKDSQVFSDRHITTINRYDTWAFYLSNTPNGYYGAIKYGVADISNDELVTNLRGAYFVESLGGYVGPDFFQGNDDATTTRDTQYWKEIITFSSNVGDDDEYLKSWFYPQEITTCQQDPKKDLHHNWSRKLDQTIIKEATENDCAYYYRFFSAFEGDRFLTVEPIFKSLVGYSDQECNKYDVEDMPLFDLTNSDPEQARINLENGLYDFFVLNFIRYNVNNLEVVLASPGTNSNAIACESSITCGLFVTRRFRVNTEIPRLPEDFPLTHTDDRGNFLFSLSEDNRRLLSYSSLGYPQFIIKS